MVISIIGMLSSVVLASLGSAREKAILSKGITFETHLSRAWGDSLVFQYTFDDSRLPYTDTSGNGIQTWSNVLGTAPSFIDGVKGKAVSSSVSNGIYNDPDYFTGNTNFNISNGSLSVYINPLLHSGTRSPVAIKGMNLSLNSDNTFSFGSVTSNQSLAYDKWNHILVS